MATNCPKSGDLLTLHYVMKMPPHVNIFVIAKVNKTRGGHRGGVWKPSTESCICNMHYKDFEGPSRRNNNVLPRFLSRYIVRLMLFHLDVFLVVPLTILLTLRKLP